MWRTTLLIVFFAGLVGVLVASVSTVMVAREERLRLNQNLVELMDAVERTASVAAFARNEQLAAEVSRGLMRNDAVAKVLIREGGRDLMAIGDLPNNAGSDSLPPLSRPLYSPFDPREAVGELQLWPASARIDKDAGAYSSFIAIID